MRPLFAALFAAALLPLTLLSQIGSQASFFGTVTDSTGGVVANAKVTATNVSTGFTRSATTAKDGNFELPAMPIGTYSVSVTANGFKKWELARTELDVGARSRISPVLQVGEVTQSVSVQSSASAVQTEKPDIETVIPLQEIRELPLDNRNPLALVSMVPGMRYDFTENGGERSTYVQGNGLRNNKTAFQLNGMNTNAPMDEGGTAIPNVDAIAEMNVQTANFSAQSGRDPMQVLVETKSGTNNFHGTLWEFLQNDALNARNIFANSKNRVRYNEFGAALGGPIIHNKTFFYANFQGTIIHNQSVYNSYAVTEAMKNGDFSGLSKKITNPFGGGAEFPDNKIPSSMINSASSYFLPYILEANTPGGYFRTNASAANDTWTGTLRLDHQLTDSQRISANWVTVRQPQDMLGYDPIPSITGWNEVTQNSIALNYSWAISPSTLLMASGGTMQTSQSYGNPNVGKKNDDELAGIQGFPTAGREAWIGPPDIFFGSGYTGVSFPGGWGVPGALWGNVYNGKVSLNHITGSHNLMAGFEYGDWHTYGEHGSQCPRGQFGFYNLYTNDGFADYLLGLPSSTCRNYPLTTFGLDRAPYTAYYVQDTWRPKSNLSIWYGLRYERWLAHHNVNDAATTWDPQKGLSVVAVGPDGKPNLNAFPVTPYLAAATQGLWTTARDVGYPDGLYEPNGNWAPRLGLAYRPFSHRDFVVRAGYGIYYNSFTGNRAGSATGNVPVWTLENQTFGLKTLQDWKTAWPSDPMHFTAFQVYAPAHNIRPARTSEWNVSVETGLPFKSALTVSYVGTRVGNEVGAMQYNEAPIGANADIQVNRPNPAFSGVQIYKNFGKNWYNGLQTKLNRRFSNGLAFTFSYSFSRSMEANTPDCETCSLIPGSPSWYNRGRTPNDFRHIEYATLVWDLPFGHGRKYFAHMNWLANALFGGWEVAATEQAQSGAPLSVSGGTANLGNGWGTRADLVGDPSVPNPSPAEWFNTDAFATPALYTFGSAGMGIIEGPGIFQLNTSLSKNFHIGEDKYFQFRWESYNLPNYVNYNNPNTSVTSGNFGKITGAHSSRYMQLALKFFF